MPANPFALLDDEEDVVAVPVAVATAPVVKAAVGGGNKAPAVKAAPKVTATPAVAAKTVVAAPGAAAKKPTDSKKEGDAYDKDTKQPSTGRRDPQGRDRKEKIPTDGNERVSKKPEERKDKLGAKKGAGKGGAGAINDAAHFVEVIADVKSEAPAVVEEKVAVAEETKDAEPEAPKTLTYVEFLAAKNSKKTIAPATASRKAGDGVDKKQWAEAQELVKADEEDLPNENAEKSGEPKAQTQRSMNKTTIAINIKLAPSEKVEVFTPRAESSAGGRGGRAPRGNNTPNRAASTSASAAASFQVDDDNFPKM